MTAFVGIAAMLVVAALCFVLPPLLTRRVPAGSGVNLPQANAQVLREQISELDAQFARGELAEAEHAQATGEIRRRVLEGAGRSPVAPGALALPSVDESPATTSIPPAGALDAASASRGRSWPVAVAVGLGVPVGVVALYLGLGSPAAIDPKPASGAAANHALSREQIAAMVGRLATRLQSQPDDFDGWVMLARSRSALAEYGAAAEAWGRASALRPADAQLLAEQADMLAMARGRKLAGDPEALVKRALMIDEHNAKALALAGSAAFEQSDYRTAIVHWKKLAQSAPEGADFVRSVQASIADAERRLAGGTVAAASASTSASASAPQPGGSPATAPAASSAVGTRASAPILEGEVVLAAPLADQWRATGTLFVIARPSDGSRVPVAVLKRTVSGFPLRFSLDDSLSMNPALLLSKAGKVTLVARLSRSGAPQPSPGDLEGSLSAVEPGARGLRIQIDRQLP